MGNRRFWIFLILSSLTLLAVVLLLWELVAQNFFVNLDYKRLHYLYITRGLILALILAGWAIWFVWRGKIRYQEKFAKIINNSTDAILVHDESGRILTMNREAESLFCDPRGEKLQSIWDILPPEERVDFSKKLKSVREGSKLVDYEMEVLLGSGKRVPVSLGLVYVDEDNGMFIGTIRDTSERVALRNKIVELEKAQVLGQLAEGVAHHMGTPLASMLLRIQMLKEDIPDSQECVGCREKLDSIERQIFYSQKVIQRLLKFARRGDDEMRPESISSLLHEGAEMVKPILKKHAIELELCVSEDIKVWANSNLLELVFSDVMMNSIDAMPHGGKISVDVHKENREGQGEQVVIKISDTGTGIPRSALPFVFDPFFTTKPAGKGTGLGLSVAKSIINDHGGEISIESTEGEGTTIDIRLPLYKEERARA